MSTMKPVMFGPSNAPAMSRNTVSGTSLLGMSLATIGQAAATSAMMAKQSEVDGHRLPFVHVWHRCR